MIKYYDPDTHITQGLWRSLTKTRDLRVIWAYIQAQTWQVDYVEYLALCPSHCPCCKNELHYGLGRNKPKGGKRPQNTPSTDHIIPASLAPELEYGVIDNLQVICVKCNRFKNEAIHARLK